MCDTAGHITCGAAGLLGVLRNATLAQIKKAFRTLAFLWHPDKRLERGDNVTEAEETNDMFIRIRQVHRSPCAAPPGGPD